MLAVAFASTHSQSGKSVTFFQTARVLSEVMGYKVLMINLTKNPIVSLKIDQNENNHQLKTVESSFHPNLDILLLPKMYHENLDSSLLKKHGASIREMIKALDYDFVLINSPSGFQPLVKMALTVADAFCVSVVSKTTSMLGLHKFAKLNQWIAREEHPLLFMGAVLNHYNLRAGLDHGYELAIEEAFPGLLFRAKIPTDYLFTDPSHRFSHMSVQSCYVELVKEMIERLCMTTKKTISA